ncbi:MAG: Flp pilus assembly complex ATPase component TadA, partial [Armatimonadota bacterium]|nr:Flp pilus assembly complex ATPase component TadA [Armatimonadota bacterium]
MTGVLPAEQTKELGQILVRQGLLTTGGLARALNHQKQTGQPLGRVLVDLELVGEEDVTRARAEQVDIAYVRMADVAIDPAVLSLVSANVAHKYLLLPVGRTPDGTLKIIVAAWNARLIAVAAKIAAAHRLQIAPALASEGPLRLALEQYYGLLPLTGGSALPAIVAPIAPRASDLFSGRGTMVARSTALSLARPEEIHETGGDQPVVIQFVNRILTAAVQRGASDIHFEPRRDALEIRFRLDGTLQHVDSVPREYQAACASRLKILAEMNIAERRLPQDGRIGVTVEGRSIDMRVSSLPTQHGEAVVLRILDKNGVRLGLEQLGFSERNLRVLQSLIRKPHGIFLVTGPTGSG